MSFQLPDDDDEEDVRFEKCALNETFQNIVENPLISIRGEANMRIAQIPEISIKMGWDQIKQYISEAAPGSSIGKVKEGFKLITTGEAGGDKMQGNQVFIKICVTSPSNHAGGPMYAEYSHAAKVAGHDLKGLGAVLSCFQVSGLHVPLMCIVDYKGSRALVMTAVPISASTQINNKNYLGENLTEFTTKQKKLLKEAESRVQTAKNKEEEGKYNREVKAIKERLEKETPRREQMVKDVENFSQEIARKLNLREHTIEDQGETKRIYFPKDLEIHEGYDGRVYALDLARLMPPERPVGQMGHLFRLFRPEFMRERQVVPLSSDAFDKASINESANFPAETEATEYLQNSIISATAAIFTDSNQKDAATLKGFLHKYGINLRYLGLFLHHLWNRSDIKGTVLQVEMVARAYAHILNGVMRNAISEMICKNSCIDKFKDILNYTSTNSILKELQDQLKRMYLPHLLDNNNTKTAHLFNNENAQYWCEIIRNNRVAIMCRVSEMTGAKWADVVLERIRRGGTINQSQDANSLTFVHVEKTIKIQPTPEVHRANGEYVKAIQCYKAEARLKKQILGPDHLRVAIALIYLAEAYSELNTSSGLFLTEQYLNQAIDIYKKARSNRRPVELDYAAALERKAKFLLRYKESLTEDIIKELLKEALEIKTKLHDVTEIANTLNLQAWSDYRHGHYEDAKNKYKECITNLRKVAQTTTSPKATFYPASLISLAMANSNLSLAVLKLGNISDADILCKIAKKMVKKPLDKMSKVDKANLATIEDNTGKIMEFISLNPNEVAGLKAPRTSTAAPSPALPSRTSTLPSQIQVQTSEEYREKAQKRFQKALVYRQQAYGDNHYLTAFSLDHIAQVLLKSGKMGEAYRRYTQALPILRTSLGNNHSSVGILIHNIAIWLASQNNYSRARAAQEEALYILYCSFGPHHKLVLDAKKALDQYNEGNSELPLPMKHDGVLAPDQPDPACFWAPYQDETHNVNSMEKSKDFQSFVRLLSDVKATKEDVNSGIIDDLYDFCETIAPSREEGHDKWDKTEENVKGIRIIKRFGTLPLNWKGTDFSRRRSSTISSSFVGKISFNLTAPFQFRDDDREAIRSRPLAEPKLVLSSSQGKDPGSIRTHQLGEFLPQSQFPVQKNPPDDALKNMNLEANLVDPAPVEEINETQEESYLVNTPRTIEEAQEILDPLLKLLTTSEWNELVTLTRDIVYNNRLLATAQRSPLAELID